MIHSSSSSSRCHGDCAALVAMVIVVVISRRRSELRCSAVDCTKHRTRDYDMTSSTENRL